MRARWKVLGSGLVGLGVVVVIIGHSGRVSGDTATSTSSPPPTTPQGTGVPATPEPTTEAPAATAPGWETTPKDPFSPYDIGSGGAWTYSDLSASDRARIDRGRNVTGWDNINSAYASASAELAHRAAAASAAGQLGITDNLGTIGVVP